jgi:hypothetical protein
VKNPTLELVPGMFATAKLVLDQATGVLVAPVESLDRTGDQSQVFVVNHEGKVEVRPVVTGLASANTVQIKQGLQAGDLVVVGNRAQLKNGTRVTPKVMEAASAGAE